MALSTILLDKRVTHNRLADPGWEARSREACRLPASWPAPPSQRRKQNLGKQSGHFLRGSHSSNPRSRIDWLGLQSRELPDPKISLQKVFAQQTWRDSMWIHCDEASAIQFHPMLGPTDESLGWKGSKRDRHQRQRGGGEAGERQEGREEERLQQTKSFRTSLHYCWHSLFLSLHPFWWIRYRAMYSIKVKSPPGTGLRKISNLMDALIAKDENPTRLCLCLRRNSDGESERCSWCLEEEGRRVTCSVYPSTHWITLPLTLTFFSPKCHQSNHSKLTTWSWALIEEIIITASSATESCCRRSAGSSV